MKVDATWTTSSSARSDGLARRLAAALAIPTVSRATPAREDAAAFLTLHAYLEKSFPLVHGALTRETIGRGHALLYTWRGGDESAEPWLLSSHQDVVPVEEGTESQWTHPPFGGLIADGYIWGRGALDVKVSLVAALEAAEQLLGQDFRPRRTIYLSFGADEEAGGVRGAKQIAARLEAQGVRLAFTLDEGGMVLLGAIPGLKGPVALVGTAEKGEILLQLCAEDSGGHSSAPGPTSAVGRLACAIAAIMDHPMPPGLGPPIDDTFVILEPHARAPYRWLYRNCRLLAPVLLRLLRRDPIAALVIRTTMAATMVRAGVAENVIPRTATAVINARVKPGDSATNVAAHLRRTVERYGVGVEVLEAREASHVSSTDSAAFRTLRETIGELMPDAVVAPFLSLNATDSRYYEPFARDQYRFLPLRLRPEDLGRFHGIDERISVENYGEVVRFFIEFIRNVDRS